MWGLATRQLNARTHLKRERRREGSSGCWSPIPRRERFPLRHLSNRQSFGHDNHLPGDNANASTYNSSSAETRPGGLQARAGWRTLGRASRFERTDFFWKRTRSARVATRTAGMTAGVPRRPHERYRRTGGPAPLSSLHSPQDLRHLPAKPSPVPTIQSLLVRHSLGTPRPSLLALDGQTQNR